MKIIRWFRNISISKKLYFVVGIMALLIAIELFTLFFSLHTLSSVRAFVGGEGLWSKAQKNAFYNLQKYARTYDNDDYLEFQNSMKVPLGDHKTLVELLKKEPDMEKARQGFLEGRNHEHDIDGMIMLFRRFHEISYINKALTIWIEADSTITQIIPISERLYAEVNKPEPSYEKIEAIIEEVDPLNEKLSILEDNFSYTLGEGARWLENLILTILLIIALTVEFTGLFLTISVSIGITKGINEIIKISEKVAKANFNDKAKIYSTDEIGQLASSFNKMMDDLHENINKLEENKKKLEEKSEFEKLVLGATQSYNSVIIADKHGKIEWVNEGFTKLTGYKLDDVLNTHGELLRKGSPTGLSKEVNFHESVIKEKQPITYESKNFTKEGKEYWVITTLTPIIGKSGEVERIIAIDSDITLRKQMEEDLVNANKIAEHSLMKGSKAINELIKAKKELEESVKVKESFLANMSHEIRTPMNAIVGFTNLLLKTEIELEQKQYVDAIKTSGENLLVIINDILDFSKMQSGKFSFEKIELNLSQLISTITELMLPKSVEKNIKLSTKIDPQIPDKLIGDPTRLSQILLNLVGNAIKFTDKGEVRIEANLISENDSSVDLQFSVIDTGIGISEDKLSTIFQGFTQASNETTRKYGGTGLGLTIVKQLVELQGGQISVKSEVEKGSAFTFGLQFKKVEKSAIEKTDTHIADNEEISIEGLKVLLVEDNLLNQVLAKKVLTDWKWNVEIAENGVIACEKAKEGDYDIILMDIQLPEMDGYEATRSIRKMKNPSKSNIPIIAMTAHAMSGEAEKCMSAGMDEYISKPFDVKNLYNKIISVLKQKQRFINISPNGTH